MWKESAIILGLGSSLLATCAGTSSNYAPLLSGGAKRGLMTCEETYGAGSTLCGGATSTMCYKPSEGQVSSATHPSPLVQEEMQRQVG